MKVSWRSFVGKGCWLQKDMGEMELVGELVEIMGYCCAKKRNKESTTYSRQVGGDYFYHEQFVGLSAPMNNPLIRSVTQGIKRAHAETGSQQRVRRPMTWGMLRGMQASIAPWGEGGRVLWIGLALSYFFDVASVSIVCQGERGVS